MATISPTDAADERYLSLIRAFRLRPLTNSAELDRAVELVDELLDRPALTTTEQEYLDVLAELIEDYEDAHIPISEANGVDVLRHLMDEHHLAQQDLVPLFGTPSIVSEVLHGKRSLALNHIRRLSEYFHLPADVFIGPPSSNQG